MSKNNTDYWGLLFQCPMNKETSNCALVHVRQLPLLDRVQYFGNLNNQDREEMIKKHKKCLLGREQRIPFSRIAIM